MREKRASAYMRNPLDVRSRSIGQLDDGVAWVDLHNGHGAVWVAYRLHHLPRVHRVGLRDLLRKGRHRG